MSENKGEDGKNEGGSAKAVDVPEHVVIFTVSLDKRTKKVAIGMTGTLDPLETGKMFLMLAAQSLSRVEAVDAEPKPRIIIPKVH